MGLTHRERVLITLDHKEPDRVPVDLGGYPTATSINVRAYEELLRSFSLPNELRVGSTYYFTAEVDEYILDRLGVDTIFLNPSRPFWTFPEPKDFIDPFLTKWVLADDHTYAPVEGVFQNLENPSVDDLVRFRWPTSEELQFPLSMVREKVQKILKTSDRARVFSVGGSIVTWAQNMRGAENWAIDLYMHPEFSNTLHEKLAEIWIAAGNYVLQEVGEYCDIVIFGDDLGTQNQTWISPQMFRERIKPLYKKMIESFKRKTKAKVGIHTCGSVYELIDDLIEVGIDILNPVQANAKNMEPEKLKKKAGDHLVFWGGIDTHVVLPTGTADDVKNEVSKKIAGFGRGGGYILSADHNILGDVPLENILAMFEAAGNFGNDHNLVQNPKVKSGKNTRRDETKIE